jgi:hypothetical protein
MISDRYAPALCLLVALALVPTVLHSYIGAIDHDGRTSAAIPAALAGYTGTPGPHDPGWGKRRFESDDWFDRRYTSANDDVVFTVIRSFDLKRLYHHPELDVAYGTAFLAHSVATLPERPSVPVHVLSMNTEGHVALYVLQYDDRFVADPLMFQARTAVELLFSPRRAMTLFFVHDLATPPNADPLKLPAMGLLLAAVDRFNAQPSQPER